MKNWYTYRHKEYSIKNLQYKHPWNLYCRYSHRFTNHITKVWDRYA